MEYDGTRKSYIVEVVYRGTATRKSFKASHIIETFSPELAYKWVKESFYWSPTVEIVDAFVTLDK